MQEGRQQEKSYSVINVVARGRDDARPSKWSAVLLWKGMAQPPAETTDRRSQTMAHRSLHPKPPCDAPRTRCAGRQQSMGCRQTQPTKT